MSRPRPIGSFPESLTLASLLAQLVLHIALCASLCSVAWADDMRVKAGERIYQEGRLASGEPLRAERSSGPIQGAAAACVNCHRRSGLGSYEGSILVPPVIGPYLFRNRETNVTDLALPHIPGYVPRAYAYTEQTLARTLRTGVGNDGRELNPLMPRYALDDASVAALTDYLKQLSAGPFAGVDGQTLNFATIVTPDADPVDRDAMLAVVEQFFKVRNASVASRVQNIRPDAAEYRAVRNWHLQVWNLIGPPETWEGQLDNREAADPVFAIISGVGRTTWAPIHRFCQRKHVPCLLPNVDLPPIRDEDFYSIYYSRGVLLDADLILTRLSGAVRSATASRLVQVFRLDDIGATAAAALSHAASQIGVSVVDRPLAPLNAASGIAAAGGDARAHAQLMEALTGLRDTDILVLWLRPPDIAAIGDAPPAATTYVSGLLANLEYAPFPAGWRGTVRLTYPYDLPDLRRVRENFPHAWFRQHGIAVTSERVQSNTYLACMIMADALGGMLDSFVPEFLVERVEGMLSRRQSTGFFPQLSLATGQRFASKGGFVVKFEGAQGTRVKADGEWTVP